MRWRSADMVGLSEENRLATRASCPTLSGMTHPNIFRYFKTSPEIIRIAVMMYVRFPLSLRDVEDLLHERGIDITHETVRVWWGRFGQVYAAEIRRSRVQAMRTRRHRRNHLDEVFVKISGSKHYLWRAVDHEGEVLESFVTKTPDKAAALTFLMKALRRHGPTEVIVNDRLASYGAALKAIGAISKRETGGWLNNQAENSHQPFRRRERAMCASGACGPYRSSLPSTRPSTTTSTKSGISFHARSTRTDATPRSLHGGGSVLLDRTRGLGEIRDFFGSSNSSRLHKLIEHSNILRLALHDLQTVWQFCNRVICMKEGRFAMDGAAAVIGAYLKDIRGCGWAA